MTLKVIDIMDVMEKHYPFRLAEAWDNIGLQVGSPEKQVNKIAIALDLDQQAMEAAIKEKVDMIITHHPLIFKAIKNIDYSEPDGRLLQSIITSDIAVYSAHTNLDAAEAGMNQVLAEILGLNEIQPLYKGAEDKLVKLTVFVPLAHLDQVKGAIHKAGAGYIGKYSECSFQTPGTGTFRPQDGAQPFLGTRGNVETVEEYRLETIAYEHDIKKIVEAMTAAHPYEETAYDIYPLLNQGRIYSIGRSGIWPEPANLKTCAEKIKTILNLDVVKIAGDINKDIRRVAVIGGSGASLINKVKNQGIDLLITGDVKYHEAQEAIKYNMAIIDAGHQETEQIIVPYLGNLLRQELSLFKNTEIILLENELLFKYL